MKRFSLLTRCSQAVVVLFATTFIPLCHAATIWTGPTTNWTKSGSTPSDPILPGVVNLTRGSRDVLYNLAAGETSAGINSPLDTEWAFGDITNYSSLSYQSMESLRNGDLAGRILNQPMVMHIISRDIYMSIQFSVWGQHGFGGGTVSYDRSTPNGVVSPSVSITNPAGGAVFAAPANVLIAADASVSSGTVTNVTFFGNGTLIGSALTAPFQVTASNLTAGGYSLTAIATAGGISSTSSPVSITVVSTNAPIIVGVQVTNGVFSFNYTTESNKQYVVETSSNLFNWKPSVTNTASGNLVPYSEGLTQRMRFFRVGRLPGP